MLGASSRGVVQTEKEYILACYQGGNIFIAGNPCATARVHKISASALLLSAVESTRAMSRRPSGDYSAPSSEEDHAGSGLTPPRPFFLASSRHSSSEPDHSADNHSDSDSSAPAHSPRNSIVAPRTRNHHRRRSQLGASQFSADSEHGLRPVSDVPPSPRPPPSSFSFPFQAYPGNPDPIPGRISRRSSFSSDVRMVSRSTATSSRRNTRLAGEDPLNTAMSDSELPLPRPPFVASRSPYRTSGGSVSSSTLYRTSAAAAVTEGTGANLPRASSATTIFRGPFLSPASRPSSVWTPPVPPFSVSGSRNGSSTALPLPTQKKTIPSTRLREKLTPQDKPWLAQKKSTLERASKWVTFGGIFLGLAIAQINSASFSTTSSTGEAWTPTPGVWMLNWVATATASSK